MVNLICITPLVILNKLCYYNWMGVGGWAPCNFYCLAWAVGLWVGVFYCVSFLGLLGVKGWAGDIRGRRVEPLTRFSRCYVAACSSFLFIWTVGLCYQYHPVVIYSCYSRRGQEGLGFVCVRGMHTNPGVIRKERLGETFVRWHLCLILIPKSNPIKRFMWLTNQVMFLFCCRGNMGILGWDRFFHQIPRVQALQYLAVKSNKLLVHGSRDFLSVLMHTCVTKCRAGTVMQMGCGPTSACIYLAAKSWLHQTARWRLALRLNLLIQLVNLTLFQASDWLRRLQVMSWVAKFSFHHSDILGLAAMLMSLCFWFFRLGSAKICWQRDHVIQGLHVGNFMAAGFGSRVCCPRVGPLLLALKIWICVCCTAASMFHYVLGICDNRIFLLKAHQWVLRIATGLGGRIGSLTSKIACMGYWDATMSVLMDDFGCYLVSSSMLMLKAQVGLIFSWTNKLYGHNCEVFWSNGSHKSRCSLPYVTRKFCKGYHQCWLGNYVSVFPSIAKFFCTPKCGRMISYFWSPRHVSGIIRGYAPLRL
ncbi:hypothetical protein Hanom_Chr00s054072g01781701 [Helianthus anomalus]